MATTTDEELIAEVLARIRDQSVNVDELEVVDTLAGVSRVPVVRGRELVSAPVDVLAREFGSGEHIVVRYVTEGI